MGIYLRKMALLAFLWSQMCVALFCSSPVHSYYYNNMYAMASDICFQFLLILMKQSGDKTEMNAKKWNEMIQNHNLVTSSMPIWPSTFWRCCTTQSMPSIGRRYFLSHDFLSDNFISFKFVPFHFYAIHTFFVDIQYLTSRYFSFVRPIRFPYLCVCCVRTHIAYLYVFPLFPFIIRFSFLFLIN